MGVREYPWLGFPAPDLTELRVHGAGATPISELLDSETYVRVAGDDAAGFYRVPPSDSIRDPHEDDPRRGSHNLTGPQGEAGQVEAYFWGKFSTGGGWRAFWILLLPFALVNVAGWIARRDSGFSRALVRLAGLLTSVAFVYWITAITIGILAECGPGSLCADRNFYLGIANVGQFAGQPSRLAVLGLLLSVVLTFILWWWPGRKSADQYERFTSKDQPEEGDRLGTRSLLSLDGERIWHSEQATRWLGAAHITAMLSAVAAGAFVAVGRSIEAETLSRSSPYFVSIPQQGIAQLLAIVCLLIFLASVLFVVWLDPLPGKAQGQRVPKLSNCAICRDPGAAAMILGTALVALAAAWFWLATTQTDPATGSDLLFRVALQDVYFRFANTGFVVIVVMILIVLALLLGSSVWEAARRREEERRPRVLGGFGPPVAVSTALVILAAMVSGGILWVADLFGEPDYRIPSVERIDELTAEADHALEQLRGLELTDGVTNEEFAVLREAIDAIGKLRDLEADLGEPLIRLGPEYYFMPLAFSLLALALAVGSGIIVIYARAKIPSRDMFAANRIDDPLIAAVNETRPNDANSGSKLEREIASLLRKPFRNRRLHLLMVAPGVMAISLAVILFRYEWIAEPATWFEGVLSLSVWLTVGIFLALAFVVRDNYRGGASRGALGGIWDIITYWPRFYHPFAPPSYAVRAVPEVAERIGVLARGERQRLLLSAHSQGVPTTIAALGLITDGDILKRIGLLTYGSPTGLLYARFFPDYFDQTELGCVAQSLKTADGAVRWTNLWRLTDWTGGYAGGPRNEQYFAFLPFFQQSDPEEDVQDDPPDGWPLYVVGSEGLQDRIGEYRLSDPDPMAVRRIAIGDPLPVPTGHSDYLHDRLYPRYRSTLVDALYQPEPVAAEVMRSDVASAKQLSAGYVDDDPAMPHGSDENRRESQT